MHWVDNGWNPAFVLAVCETLNGMKSAGFYAENVQNPVLAINEMIFPI